MTLHDYAVANDWNTFEDKWTELMVQEGSVEELMEALAVVAQKREIPRFVAQIREHAEVLGNNGNPKAAVDLLGFALLRGGSPGELGGPLLARSEEAWGEEPWWPVCVELAGFREGSSDIREAWTTLQKLLQLRDGYAVYHPSGWGVGRIEASDLEADEVKVVFASGKRDTFPVQTALDIFEILSQDDLRALVVVDPEELKRLLKKEPLKVLRDVMRRYQGRTSYASLRTALAQYGVEGPSFSAWWRKTRKEAEPDPWFEITGAGNKAQVRMLANAADPLTSITRQLKRCRTLHDALTRTRDFLESEAVEGDARKQVVDQLDEMVAEHDATQQEMLSTWLYLREQREESPPALLALLQRTMEIPAPTDPGEQPALWALFGSLSTLREQERCMGLLSEIYGETEWLEEAARNIQHVPPGMARPMIEKLLEAERSADLAETYRLLLARPTRNPHLLLQLAEFGEKGKFGDHPLPPPVQRLESLIRLAGYVKNNASGNTMLTRVRTKLGNQLPGKTGLMRKLLDDADRGALQTIRVLIDRGVDDAIDNAFTEVAVERVPDLFSRDDRPFWESDSIYSTRKGLELREAELRELREVKIPENSEAIGKAASFGDLSENSEWEAAIEEQRNLTSRASEIEKELQKVQLIENALLPEDTVCPGTQVVYRDLRDDDEQKIVIVGPWDTDLFSDAISYQAPLAMGLLGLKPGRKGRVKLPSGEVEVQVVEVAPMDL